jgi:hypothetical protein
VTETEALALATDPDLAVPGAGPVGSPIGCGFTVLWTVVTDSARGQAGPRAFTVDMEGDEVLAYPWPTAAAALLDTAMARGEQPRHVRHSHRRAVMIGNDHVRFGPEAAGKGLLMSTSPAAYRSRGRAGA